MPSQRGVDICLPVSFLKLNGFCFKINTVESGRPHSIS